jgi:hypothetical protein
MVKKDNVPRPYITVSKLHTVGTSDEGWTRDRTKPRESRENPVGFNSNDP